MFEEWEPDRLFELHRRRVERYLPIWFAAHPIVAEAAGTAEHTRELHRQRMAELLDRVDRVRAGEAVVKARMNETESAISAVSNGIRQRMPAEPWSERARNAAQTARSHLRLPNEPPSKYPAILAGEVYRWAEIESGFQGDSAALLQRLAPQETDPGPDGNYHDNQHLLYGRPTDEAGLGDQGRRVYAEVATIVATLESDLPAFVVDASFWQGSPSPAARHRADGYRDFHRKPPPPWGA